VPTDQGPYKVWQGQLAAARESAGVLSQPCGLGEGIAVDVLAQIAKQLRKGSAIESKG